MAAYSQLTVAAAAALNTVSSCSCSNSNNIAGVYNVIVSGQLNANNNVNMASNCQVNGGGAINVASGSTFTLASSADLQVEIGGSVSGAGVLNILGDLINLNIGICIGICLDTIGGPADQIGPQHGEWWTAARIAGITVAATCALGIIVVTAVFLRHRALAKKQQKQQNDTKFAAVPTQKPVDEERGDMTTIDLDAAPQHQQPMAQ